MKKVIVFTTIAVAVGVVFGLYFFLKEPPNVRITESDFNITADELVSVYADESAGDKKFLGKIISVTGRVASIDNGPGGSTIYMESSDPLIGITCSFYGDESPSVDKVKAGDIITVKGACTGKLTDVVLNYCSIIKK